MTKLGFFYNINMQHFASLKESLKEFRPNQHKAYLARNNTLLWQ